MAWLYLSAGSKGRLRASGIEFTIVESLGSTSSRIRYRFERNTIDVMDDDLRFNADNIDAFTEPEQREIERWRTKG